MSAQTNQESVTDAVANTAVEPERKDVTVMTPVRTSREPGQGDAWPGSADQYFECRNLGQPRRLVRLPPEQVSEPGWMRRHGLALLGEKNQLDRLGENICAVRASLVAWDAEFLGGTSYATQEYRRHFQLEAEELLCAAAHAYSSGQGDTGWSLVHRAREAELALYSLCDLRTRALALEEDLIQNHLPGPHRAAVRALASDQGKRESKRPAGPATVVSKSCRCIGGPARERAGNDDHGACWSCTAAPLRSALEGRNNYYNNLYAALGVTARRRLWLMSIGGVLLVCLLVLLVWTRVLQKDPRIGNGLDLTWLPLTMALLGALGSVISAVQRLTRYPVTGAIPASLGSFTAALSRPLIGAVAAFSVYLAARSDLVTVPDHGALPLLLLAGLTAGLTERLVTYDDQRRSQTNNVPTGG